MKTEEGQEWIPGDDPNNFAEAARNAVENAEQKYRERGEEFPKVYDVQMQVLAHGPLSGYRVWVSPGG